MSSSHLTAPSATPSSIHSLVHLSSSLFFWFPIIPETQAIHSRQITQCTYPTSSATSRWSPGALPLLRYPSRCCSRWSRRKILPFIKPTTEFTINNQAGPQKPRRYSAEVSISPSHHERSLEYLKTTVIQDHTNPGLSRGDLVISC